MNAAADLVVVGGGPAGAAAGIWALTRGLRVTLLERSAAPRARPGETLHPGVEPIFKQLGVREAVEAVNPLRPTGQITAWGGAAEYVPYGSDERGSWRAFQVMRADLDRILLARFESLGGSLTRPAAMVRPLVDRGLVAGVSVDGATVRAPFVVDASGAGGFLRHALRIGLTRWSPTLIARCGYAKGESGNSPRLTGDRDGWVWTAQVGPDLVQWTRLAFADSRLNRGTPDEVANFPDVGKQRATDVTWRLADRLAGPGYFLAGEAAAVLDPAASHGVLRALMTGIMAASQAADVLSGQVRPELAASHYAAWVGASFRRDAMRMCELYSALGVSWRNDG